MAQGPSRDDLDALKQGAAVLLQAGNRVAALSLLWSAVAIDPTDLSSHRRLAATLANGGDIDGAADEFARFIEFVLPSGDIARAMDELSYGVNMVGGHDALHGAAEKIACAIRGLVPPVGAALASPAPLAAIAAAARTPVSLLRPDPAPSLSHPDAAVVSRSDPASTIESTFESIAAREAAVQLVSSLETAAPPAPMPAVLTLPTPRLLPRVPFRFCLHDAGDRHWMQLEGGSGGLRPDAVRAIDRWENVVEERLCRPLARGQGHGTAVAFDVPPVAWVVMNIPTPVATAYDVDGAWSYTFQAKVHDDWLAVDLFDTGCRRGRTHAVSAS